MDADSILQEKRCVEQVYRDDDELLQRCRADGSVVLNGFDTWQHGVMVQLRNVAGEELGFIRATFRQAGSQQASTLDLLQLCSLFASLVIQHATSGPQTQLTLPVRHHAWLLACRCTWTVRTIF